MNNQKVINNSKVIIFFIIAIQTLMLLFIKSNQSDGFNASLWLKSVIEPLVLSTLISFGILKYGTGISARNIIDQVTVYSARILLILFIWGVVKSAGAGLMRGVIGS